jgi:hypothetical protein
LNQDKSDALQISSGRGNLPQPLSLMASGTEIMFPDFVKNLGVTGVHLDKRYLLSNRLTACVRHASTIYECYVVFINLFLRMLHEQKPAASFHPDWTTAMHFTTIYWPQI